MSMCALLEERSKKVAGQSEEENLQHQEIDSSCLTQRSSRLEDGFVGSINTVFSRSKKKLPHYKDFRSDVLG